MSIEFFPYDTSRCSLSQPRAFSPRSSPRRIAANRRNAQRSTGPRTASGKKRSSMNSLKHGLASSYACLPSEDLPTFHVAMHELRREFQPQSVVQTYLFNQIANLFWRLSRLPEAQAAIFTEELHQSADDETLSPAQVLARRFSAAPNNGFSTLSRYERGMHSMLLRLLRQYDLEKKRHAPGGPARGSNEPVPREESKPAWSEEQQRAQQEAFEKRRAAAARHEPPRNEHEARIDQALWLCEGKKRTQSNPTQNPIGDSESEKYSTLHNRAGAERSHCGPISSPLHPLTHSPPPKK